MPTISELIAKVESNNVQWAMRYEAHFKPSVAAINNCIAAHRPAFMSRSTAEMICKTSWGKYQIMGENLYTICGLKDSVNLYMSDADLQEETFFRFLEKRDINYTVEQILEDAGKMSKFARRYNGSTTYVKTLHIALGVKHGAN